MNRNRASGPHGNRKASATPRWVGTNWRRPEVSIRRKGIGHAVARKVKATGIARIEAGEQLAEAVERMLEGKEVRLTAKGADAIRLFACMNKSCTEIDAVAKTMGDLRKCLSEVGFTLSHRGKPITEAEAAKMVRQVEAEREERKANMVCVTPDTVVTCPKCGFFPIRVGEVLSKTK